MEGSSFSKRASYSAGNPMYTYDDAYANMIGKYHTMEENKTISAMRQKLTGGEDDNVQTRTAGFQ